VCVRLRLAGMKGPPFVWPRSHPFHHHLHGNGAPFEAAPPSQRHHVANVPHGRGGAHGLTHARGAARAALPPLAASSATFLAADNPAAFASQLTSALSLESAARNQVRLGLGLSPHPSPNPNPDPNPNHNPNQATSQLSFDAGGHVLPTAPPGHQYVLAG